MDKYIPLSNGFTLMAFIAFFLSAWYTLSGVIPLPWGFTLTLFSIILLVAAIVSITPKEDPALVVLDIEKRKISKDK